MKVPKEFWSIVPILPIPTLKKLRDLVIAHSEKRMPKWKFRLASDLVMQLQPKVSSKYAVMFEGHAVETEGADAAVLLRPSALRNRRYRRLNFQLYSDWNSEQWQFKPTRVSIDGHAHIHDCVLGIFQDDQFRQLNPSRMLSPNCMICGKGLTDPVSMASMIGPECRGSASLNVPGLRDLMGPKEEKDILVFEEYHDLAPETV